MHHSPPTSIGIGIDVIWNTIVITVQQIIGVGIRRISYTAPVGIYAFVFDVPKIAMSIHNDSLFIETIAPTRNVGSFDKGRDGGVTVAENAVLCQKALGCFPTGTNGRGNI